MSGANVADPAFSPGPASDSRAADQPAHRQPAQTQTKRLFVQSYGCQMNVYDSDRMKDVLAPLGYTPTDTPDGADMVILNTCHIREKATEKVYSEIGRIRAHKEAKAAAGGRMTLVIAGCVAQAEGEEIIARAPSVDLVVGPQQIHRLPELIATAARKVGERIAADFAPNDKFDNLPPPRADGPTAFLSIQEGCDKFCTFCVVPYTRGAEYSRPVAAILDEARALVGQGVREITVLGQNVNAYHGLDAAGRETPFAALLAQLAELTGLERLRYTTSHPAEMHEDLIALHGAEPKLMPQLHLPVQSGSDRILKAMNRKHTAAQYLDLVARLRAARSDLSLSTDLIVGFPGETDKDFEDTLALVRAVGFASAFSFKYSKRPGTPAALMFGQVQDAVAHERLLRLQALLTDQQRAHNEAMVGRTLPVLFTGPGRRDGQIHGRSPYLQAVHCDGPAGLIGQIADVFIEAASLNSLSGRLAPSMIAAA
jgi:tRNA-2-methylthio-N6-dimethylallyladenosine synthase